MKEVVRKNVLRSYVKPILLYGSESWTVSKLVRNYLEVVEKWFYKRMIRIPWTYKRQNWDVFREMNWLPALGEDNAFFGHVIRGRLEYAMSTGKLEGKRREDSVGSLASWHGGISISEMIGCTQDRRLGRHDNQCYMAWAIRRRSQAFCSVG
ncbi:hypothetical protein BsWGS_20154 [Bradybaena similaris]